MTAPLRFPLAAPAVPDDTVLAARSTTVDFVDELGERRLALDAAGVHLEVLDFRKELAEAPIFEAAVRARVDEVRHLTHPSLAVVHSVERSGPAGLSLVSRHVAGRRLTDMSPDDWGPAFALNMVRTVTPVLAMLHGSGAGLAHGTLSPDRVIVDPEGRVVVVEHVMGSAIEALGLSRKDLLTLDLVVPDEIFPVPLNLRCDMVQLGFLVLSLLLGRRLAAADYPVAMVARLDEFANNTGSPLLSIKMRSWLERALQIDARPFATAQEACDAFDVLPNDIDVQRAESKRAWLAFPSESDTKPGPTSNRPKIAPAVAAAAPAKSVLAAPTQPVAAAPAPSSIDDLPDETAVPVPPANAAAPDAATPTIRAKIANKPDVGPQPTPTAPAPPRSRMIRVGFVAKWVIAGLLVLAAGEAIGLWLLAQKQPLVEVRNTEEPATSTVNAATLAEPTPTPEIPTAGQRDVVAAPPGAGTPPPASTPTTSAPTAAPANPPVATLPAPQGAANTAAVSPTPSSPKPAPRRTGRLTVSSAIPLQVFMDGQLIGSSAGPLTVSEGSHHFEFVNDALDFRFARNVDVKGGQRESIAVAVPNGRINVNATPWAEVTIDGSPVGETPLANLSLPIGVHEITFRHPQLGVRNQTVVVKAGALLRVAQMFQIPLLARGKW